MNAVIIGAMTPATPIENYYRHQMLRDFLQKHCQHETAEVIGSDGEFNESAMMILQTMQSEQRWDYINIARLFNQDYILMVENDRVYSISCKDAVSTYLGIWWDIDCPSCPGTVVEAVTNEHKFTQILASGQTWGIQTPEMARKWAAWCAESVKPSFLGGRSKIENDAHLARTYPYAN